MWRKSDETALVKTIKLLPIEVKSCSDNVFVQKSWIIWRQPIKDYGAKLYALSWCYHFAPGVVDIKVASSWKKKLAMLPLGAIV